MSIKQQIIAKSKDAQIEFNEYENLILDEMPIDEICQEDQEFL